MYPIKALVARTQTSILKNYSKSRYGKRLNKFYNIHCGETCFIIGNGPSLKVDDLNKISELGIPSFAFNRIFCIFSDTTWRPTYYISQDENVTIGMEEQFKNLDLPFRFHPIRWKWYKGINIPKAYYFRTISNKKNCKVLGFSKDFSVGAYETPTVAYSAFQLAYYMGFKRVYLIGFDQNYKKSLDKDGNVVINDEVEKDYFSDKYKNEKTDDLKLPNLFKMNKAFISVDYYIKNNEIDMEVFNATRGGMLEVFPRVDVDDVFENLRRKNT